MPARNSQSSRHQGTTDPGDHAPSTPSVDPTVSTSSHPASAFRASRAPARRDALALLRGLTRPDSRSGCVTHVEHVPPREGRFSDWPSWLPSDVISRFFSYGIKRPWSHQAEAARLAYSGKHVVIATGTASGKSLGYLLPAAAELAGQAASPRRTSAVLYLSPTKALAADQLRALQSVDLPGVRATTVDGDSTREQRDWARDHATYVLTNPDMLHRTLLPGHARWSRFFAALSYVVIDECHQYRGVFGAHVAQVIRRLRRVLASYGANPRFVLASATVSSPSESAARLTGLDVEAVTDDGSPHGGVEFALWEPSLTTLSGENGAPVRRSAPAEAARLLADLVIDGVRTVAFVRSRRWAEIVALQAADHVEAVDAELATRVAAYRAGYLAEDRRALEQALQDGTLIGAATTNALELGVDIAGLDAVLLAGFPGTRASLWQQAGRAGREGQGALAVFIARDDPLDTYLVRHPEAVFGTPVEATVFDPDNPYVVRPHLAAAAAELPLTDDDVSHFGSSAPDAIASLEAEGLLRRRPHGWFWARRGRASDLVDIRSTGGAPVRIVESSTGRLLGTVDAASAHSSVHDGAVHLHRGETYIVEQLDLEADVALVARANPDYTTTAREVTDLRILDVRQKATWGAAELCTGPVEVTAQVVSYTRRLLRDGRPIGEVPLELPSRTLTTQAVWWTVPDSLLADAGFSARDIPGAAHAAEHASIGLLPLFATCDRWDIGGVSTAKHADTDKLTVFVYDGHPGGAGFSARGFSVAADWIEATRAAIRSCECTEGCPSCVQSPKCGNGNNPLDKAGAIRLLDILLAGSASATTHQ